MTFGECKTAVTPSNRGLLECGHVVLRGCLDVRDAALRVRGRRRSRWGLSCMVHDHAGVTTPIDLNVKTVRRRIARVAPLCGEAPSLAVQKPHCSAAPQW